MESQGKSRDHQWSETYPELGTDHISFEDTISPSFYEAEREAVFRESWLYIGRVERVARKGQYFTKELECLKTSLLVTRDNDDQVQVFYNVCPHRANKLVWDTYANQEVSGQCRTFYCKLHGLGFGTDGNIEKLTDEKAWYGEQGTSLKLAKVPFDIWNGFIFVNLRRGGPKETLTEFMGEHFATGFDGFPFEAFDEHHHFTLSCKANWKLMMDGFSEGYHGAVTHALPIPVDIFFPDGNAVIRQNYFGVHGNHRQFVSARWPEGLYNFDVERMTQAVPVGPRHPGQPDVGNLPIGANPNQFDNWGTSANMFWPNIHIQFYWPGWYVTFAFWPLAYDEMRFELDIYMPKARNFSELLSHKAAASLFLEAALQDFSLLEATQQGLENRAFDSYPLTDQEILIREFHQKIAKTVRDYRKVQGLRPA